MAKNNDCIVAECDRCGRFAWYTPSNAAALKNDWWDVQRLDADGNQHGYYFCSNCHQEYVNRLRDADNSFESWKKNGGKQNG